MLTAITLAMLVAATNAPPVVVPAKPIITEIPFLDSLEAGQIIAEQRGLPLVLQFTASWCGPCRQMEKRTFAAPQVIAKANEFVWVKIDIDLQPGTAARFGVRSIPQTAVLAPDGSLAGQTIGAMSPDAFLDFLAGASALIENADVPATPRSTAERVTALIKAIADPARAGRRQAMETLRSLGPEALPILIDQLESNRLALRAAAGYALAQITRAELPFDPFAAPAVRSEQVNAWREWCEQMVDAVVASR